MDTQAHLGKGLSLSQIISALNEELKHSVYSPSFTLDKVSQLDRDVSAALATIREWRNSLVHINRIPLEILSLVPTHLSPQDRVRSTFVCRHWRRTFLEHPVLWSDLYLRKNEVYVKTLLERAGGCPLDIVSCSDATVGVMSLLLPHIQQTRSLNFNRNNWAKIQTFLELHSGPLPLLRTLEIDNIKGIDSYSPDATTPPSVPLFSNATNLQEFWLRSPSWIPLNHFVFPNLTFFELSVPAGLRVSQLFDFLEASPMLQRVVMEIYGVVFYDGIARERVSVLRNVESFFLAVNDERGYKLAAHISCPSAKHTSFIHEPKEDPDGSIPQEIFPASVSWNTIIRQYTTSPVEEVALEMVSLWIMWTTVECTLTFRSPNASVIRLRFEFAEEEDRYQDIMPLSSAERYCQVFSQASRTIRDLALLADIKRLHVSHRGANLGDTRVMRITNEVGRLFKSVGPLEELIFHCCETQPYFDSFFNNPEFLYTKQPIVFPPIKELTVSYPLYVSGESFMVAIVGLVKSQHALGVPFERVTVRMHDLPAEMEDRLRPWVGAAHCYQERLHGGD